MRIDPVIIPEDIVAVATKFDKICSFLDERSRRMWCAVEAESFGYGGITLVHKATGLSKTTIMKGARELKLALDNLITDPNTVRTAGGGRKSLADKYPNLLADLDELVEPATRGDPENPLRWSSKSTIKLARVLNEKGYRITQRTVYNLLEQQGYSMKSNRKSLEGKADHPDRDAQFEFINEQAKTFQQTGNPVLSIDTKKKENIGNFKNNGKEWSTKAHHTEVLTHDFPDKTLGKVAPHGVYDIHNNLGWVCIGISSDTAEFAVNSIRNWHAQVGREIYTDKIKKIMITADCGGSNNYRSRLWKFELQKLSNELQIEFHISHFPPGTSKWNKIEHRLFSYISTNWRGKPLINLQTVVELIGNTTTQTGLKIKVIVDNRQYDIGKKVSDEDFHAINIQRNSFHGEWNYIIRPQMNS
jgi:Rhodopirellula transposase DDE domain